MSTLSRYTRDEFLTPFDRLFDDVFNNFGVTPYAGSYTKNSYPKVDVVAEGHYHQNVDFMVSGTHYINFSSFACNQSYFSVQSSSETEFAQKQLRGCNG